MNSAHLLSTFTFHVAQLVRKLPAKAGDLGSIPGSGRSPAEGNSYPLQYACLKSPMDRGAWWATVCGVAESDVTEHAQWGDHTEHLLCVGLNALEGHSHKKGSPT